MSTYCKDHDGKDSHKRHISYLLSISLIGAFFTSLLMAVLGKMPWNYFLDEFIAVSVLIGGGVGVTAFSDVVKRKKEDSNTISQVNN